MFKLGIHGSVSEQELIEKENAIKQKINEIIQEIDSELITSAMGIYDSIAEAASEGTKFREYLEYGTSRNNSLYERIRGDSQTQMVTINENIKQFRSMTSANIVTINYEDISTEI